MKSVLLLGITVLALGCETTGYPAYVYEPTTDSGLTYSSAVSNAKHLEFAMPLESIRSYFGDPSQTSMNTCGQDLGSPWKCLEWEYIFILDQYNSRRLSIYFQQSDGQWYVNSWDWWDF